jgi:UDP-N-acetylglucosamine 2-epimerase (non-hydrolysing)
MRDRAWDPAADVAVVFGTRPEIIKLAPVLAELAERAWPVFTGQHYDTELTGDIVRSCGLPSVAPALAGVGGCHRSRQIPVMIDQLGSLFAIRRPAAVVVQGDTNTTNAGAQAGHYLGVPVVHVEAGLRSGDRAMPEEINRQVVSVLADVHCAATPHNARTLVAGGVEPARVHVTGNPVIESVRRLLPDPAARAAVARACGLPEDSPFVLATLHRPENTDDRGRLATVLDQLRSLADAGTPVVMPLHPRTWARMAAFGLAPTGLRVMPPVDYRAFLALAAEAAVIVSDSGGLQEEVTVLGTPLVVVRTSTERPESVAAGFSTMASPSGIVDAARRAIGRPRAVPVPASPFGDGRASLRIADLARAAASAATPAPGTPSLTCPAHPPGCGHVG